MFWRHPVLGVGWDNFGPHYLRDRLPAASEEIRDPHDFPMRFLVELGSVGFVLMTAWLGRLWWEFTRPTAPPAPGMTESETPRWGPVLFVAGIAGAAIMINIFASIDFNQTGSWVFVELINRMLYFCAADRIAGSGARDRWKSRAWMSGRRRGSCTESWWSGGFSGSQSDRILDVRGGAVVFVWDSGWGGIGDSPAQSAGTNAADFTGGDGGIGGCVRRLAGGGMVDRGSVDPCGGGGASRR